MKKENALAVQPSAWVSFDAHGALWATDINHARALAAAWGEPCTLWVCPPNGREWAFSRV